MSGGRVHGGFMFDGVGDYVDMTVTQDKNSTSLWYKNSTASVWTHVAFNYTDYFINGIAGTLSEYPILFEFLFL